MHFNVFGQRQYIYWVLVGTDQLEVGGWLENRSTESLVRLEAPPTSSVIRENSLLRLVMLPRSLDSGSKQNWTLVQERYRMLRTKTQTKTTLELILGANFYQTGGANVCPGIQTNQSNQGPISESGFSKLRYVMQITWFTMAKVEGKPWSSYLSPMLKMHIFSWNK